MVAKMFEPLRFYCIFKYEGTYYGCQTELTPAGEYGDSKSNESNEHIHKTFYIYYKFDTV